MAEIQSHPEKVGNIPSKKRKKKKSKNVYCDLCRRSYNKGDIQVHMHSMQHHRELEAVLGKNSSHECQVCKKSSMDLNVYAQHISTGKHIGKLKSLKSRDEKPPSMYKILGTDVMMKIQQRNKMLKKSKRKDAKKKRKRMKAGQKRAEKQAVQNDAITSKVARMGDFKQNKMILKHDIQNEGKNNAFFQNKENNVSCREIWQLPYNQDQFIPLAQQLRSGDHFSVNSHSSTSKPQGHNPDMHDMQPHSTQAYHPRMPEHVTWSAVRQHDTHKKPYDPETDFVNDVLPQNGAIIFDQSLGPSKPLQQRSRCSPPPAPANTSTNAVLIRDVDISSMLRQIRRELGVREPCRADREARRQNSEAAGVKMVQPAGAIEGALNITSAATTSVRPSPVSSHEPVSDSGVRPFEKVPAQPKCTSAKMTQRGSQTCEKSSVYVGDTYGPSHCSTASPEAEVTVCRRDRIAHKPRKVHEWKEANKELSLREVCQDVRRKTQQKAKGTARSADGLLIHVSEQHISTQAEDVPLSEGFHWESLQHSPSFAHWSELPHQSQDATYSKSCAETAPLIEIAPKHPDPEPEDGNRQTSSVQAEQILEGENGDLIGHISAPKRKRKVVTHDGVSDEEPRGKKKLNTNKDQDQMAQLLTVSLREEELSHSLEALDSSLILARNALQAAYTEVQRLLLFRQQCTAEVNSLRSKRITILQGMQGGFSFPGESIIAERNVTSALEPAAAVTQSQIFPLSSSAAFPTSSCLLPLQTNPVSSISRPQPASLAPPTMPLKQEIEQLPLSCTSQVPVNQSVRLFPPSLLPSLLLTSPHLASCTTSSNSLDQPRTEFTVSVSVSPESSACQQEQVRREALKDFVKTVVLIADTDDQGADIRPVAEKTVSTVVPERYHNMSAVVTSNSGGSESDDSVIMMEPSNWDVINIDETVANVPLHQDIPQKSDSVEYSSASTQTSHKNNAKSSLPAALVQDAAVPPASAVEEEEEEQPSLGLFENHQGPVHGLQVYKGRLYTCSGNNTARSYSLKNKECQAVFTGHTKKVNSLVVSSLPNMPVRLFTGSSDQTICCYDIKTQVCLEQIFLLDRVLCLHIAWNILFAGLANGSVANYDLKTLKQLDVFECHGPRGVSSLGTAQEGARRVLLVGSYDSTISVRDARNGLLLRTLEGHTKTVLCMKVVNDLVFSGSSDTSVHAHNIHTGELIRIYKGHGHAVTSIVILGEVMVTACLDKMVRVYELQSHDLLQVYGGHRDVVMCMTVHKSVIYTGCYDGSVQAVKLDLMKNYRCWWQNCSLIFGMEEHLVQHLVKDHTNPNLQTAKCRWKGCSTFFAKQESVRQDLPEHMQRHVENDSKVHT